MRSKEEHMLEALELAKRGSLTASPNPLVGCVITHENKVIGRGWHERSGENHAEINAIEDVFRNLGNKSKEALKESELFVNLEPCTTFGKTPPCADSISEYGIRKVYFGNEDKAQQGFSKMHPGIEVESGLLEKEGRKLNRGFFSRIEKGRPYISCKVASALDGGIALPSGESKWITSSDSRKDVHKIRAHSDAILTGIGTILKDNPQLTSRDSGLDEGSYKQPLRVVVDRNNALTGKENIFSSGTQTLLFINRESQLKDNENVEIAKLRATPNLPLEEVVKYLAEEKLINNLMVEAGSGMINSLLLERLVDELILYKGPKLLGENRQSFVNLDVATEKLGTINLEIDDTEEIGEDVKYSLLPKY